MKKTRSPRQQDRTAKDREPERRPEATGSGSGKTPDIDPRLSKRLYDETTKISRKAFRSLLEEAATARIKEKIGDRIQSLVNVVVDELLADFESNQGLEVLGTKRKKQKKKRAKAVRAALAAKKNDH